MVSYLMIFEIGCGCLDDRFHHITAIIQPPDHNPAAPFPERISANLTTHLAWQVCECMDVDVGVT